jgi:hypothetical protein
MYNYLPSGLGGTKLAGQKLVCGIMQPFSASVQPTEQTFVPVARLHVK